MASMELETCGLPTEMKQDEQSKGDDIKRNQGTKIKEGDTIILKKGKIIRVFQVRRKRQVWLDKLKFTLDGVIGHLYGSTFEVRDGAVRKISKAFKEEEALGTEKGVDNRDLHDLDSNQKLSRDDIEKMKREGAKGQEIIDQLIENSVTFKAKTEYAQEKWIKKKKKKHVAEYTVLKPTTRLLCEMYHEKSPAKILHMRMDTLAQILTYGNIHAYTNVAVVDTTVGLVVGAVLERQGGHGKVIHFHPGDTPIRPALENYDFPSHFLDSLYNFPLHYVNSLKSQSASETIDPQKSKDSSLMTCGPESTNTEDTQTVKQQESDSGEITEVTSAEQSESKGDQQDQEVNGDKSESAIKEEEIQKRKLEKESRRESQKIAKAKQMSAARLLLQQHKIDCLVVACKYHPTPIVMALVDYVAPSRPVIVYSQHKEAVMDAYAYLREKTGVINFRVSETWLREFQVMPMRTHPVIQMSGGGGYLLTATTVIPS